MILTSDGDIVTNSHVVAVGADPGFHITVLFDTGVSALATIIGQDSAADIAVLHVTATGLTPAAFASSSRLAIGQPVLALGSPLGLANTVTAGIISALNRPVTEATTQGGPSGEPAPQLKAIQTDTPINPGNSGGALVNYQGQVIGIITAQATSTAGSGSISPEQGSIGLGFAIPADQAVDTADRIITGAARHGHLGATVTSLPSAHQAGALVTEVAPSSPAAAAGLRPHDVITAINGHPVTGPRTAEAIIQALPPGTGITLTIRRDNTTLTFHSTLTGSP